MHKMTRDEIVILILETWSASNNASRNHVDTLRRDPDNVTAERMLSRSSAQSAAFHNLMMEIRKREGA